MIPAVILLAGVLLFLVWASASICSGIYLKVICRNKPGKKQLALSFDDGPHPEYTPRVLDLLDRYGAKASFFLVGSRMEGQDELVREIHRRGHSLGNHGYTHHWSFPLRKTIQIQAELARTSDLLQRQSGEECRYFRPPFGVSNPPVGRACRKSGLQAIGWSVRSLDTRGEPAGKVIGRIRGKIRDGSILLLHDHSPHIFEILDEVLVHCKQEGLTCVNLNTFLDHAPVSNT